MKKMIALLVAAVFAAGTGLVEAAPKKAGAGHAVAGKAVPKAKKLQARKTRQLKKAPAAKHGQPVKKKTTTKKKYR